MKKIKFYRCLLFLFIWTLTGCGEVSTDSEVTPKDSYIESMISLPEGVIFIADIVQLENGTIRMAGLDSKHQLLGLWDSEDEGQSWTQVSMDEKLINKKGECYYKISSTKEAIVYFVEENVRSSYYIDEDGKSAELKEDIPYYFSWSEDGELFGYSWDSNIKRIDKSSGDIVLEYHDSNRMIETASAALNKLFVYSEKQIFTYDIETGDIEKNESVFSQLEKEIGSEEEMYATFGMTVEVKEDKFSACTATRKGIHKFQNDSTSLIISGEDSFLSNNSLFVDKVEMLQSGNIMLCLSDGKKSILARYSYSEDAGETPDMELTIYSLVDNEVIKQAANIYEAQNPGISIRFTVGLEAENEVTISDAIKTLNADILSSNGPDIIIMDGMPINNYINQDLLVDISDLVLEACESGEVLEPVVSSFQSDNGIYALPVNFALMMLLGDEQTVAPDDLQSLVNSLETLKKNNQMDVYCGWSYEHMVSILFRSYFSEKVEKNEITESDLDIFYESIMKIYEYNTKKDETIDRNLSDIVPIPTYFADAIEVMNQEAQMALDYVIMPDSYQMMIAARNQTDLELKLFGQKDESTYIPLNIVSLNASGNQIEAAKSFVKYLITEQAQESYSYGGLPVNLEVMKKEFERQEEIMFEGAAIPICSKEEQDDFFEMLTSLDTAVNVDWVIQDVIMRQADDLKRGKIKKEEAVSNALQKINLYLEE